METTHTAATTQAIRHGKRLDAVQKSAGNLEQIRLLAVKLGEDELVEHLTRQTTEMWDEAERLIEEAISGGFDHLLHG